MRSAVAIALKDLKRSLRDRSALAISLVAPLVLAFILNAVLPEEELDITYGVVNQDGGPVSEGFVEQVLGGNDGFARVRELDSRRHALQLADDDSIAAAFVFPEGFSHSVSARERSTIEVIGSPASELGAPIARAMAEAYAAELDAIGLSIATTISEQGGSPAGDVVHRARRAATEMGAPVSLVERRSGSREFDDNTFFAAGMAVFFLFFTTQFGAVSLLRERREGTLTRLLAAPAPRGAVVAGKALFTFVLGIGSLTVLIVATAFLLGARWGDPVGVALMVVAAVFAAMGVQSLVTTLATTDEQAAGYGSIIAVTLGLLGGTFFPLSQAPSFVGNLSYLTPHAWIMRGLGDLSGGAGTIGDIAPSLVALLLFGAVTGGIALLRARNLMVTR